ncbi:MAG: PfkB family carbohydrate kinase [Acidimicrobiales bacterium]
MLGGPGLSPMLPADIYRRLSADLVANGRTVVVDLSGEPLAAAAAGGASVMRMSHEELLAEGRAADDTVPALAAAMRSLSPEGASAVVCCQAERPALAWFGGRLVEVHAPVFAASDNAGAGDSFTAGLAAALANGCSLDDALRLGAAAGGLNVTRRGLGAGARQEIERLAAHVELVELDPGRLLA